MIKEARDRLSGSMKSTMGLVKTRTARKTILFGAIFALISLYFTIELYENLHTNFQELLPPTARSVTDVQRVSQKLVSFESLALLIFSNHTQASKRFVKDLAVRLRDFPPMYVSSVEYEISPEIKLFRQREALYMDLSDLEKIRNYIESRISYEGSLLNPLNIFSEQEITEPRLNVPALLRKYDRKYLSYARLPGGYFATPDEKVRAILIHVPGQAFDIGTAEKLKARVEKTIVALNPKSYSPDVSVKYTGGIENEIEEHEGLVADLELSTAVVAVLVSLAMLAFFRSVRATAALVLSLFMGTLCTFGVARFLVGYLNANSAFLGSIVLGNGINFGIIFLARYLEERRQGKSKPEAIHLATQLTSRPTITAALAAGLSYGSLALTQFRGFSQFGIIGLVGMVLCWISAYTLLPSFLLLWDHSNHHPFKTRKVTLTGSVAKGIDRFPWLICSVALLLAIASIAQFHRLSSDILETNLGKLRNRTSLERGSAYYSRYLDQIFERYLSPIVILVSSPKSANRIEASLLRAKTQDKRSLIASVQSLDDFVPKNQASKIDVIRQIRGLLRPSVRQALPRQERALAKRLFFGFPLRPLTTQDLPPRLLSEFTEKNGNVGRLVLVTPTLSKSLWKRQNLIHLVSTIRRSVDAVDPGAPVAGTLAITADMAQAITRDGPRATLISFLAVVILVILLFRNVKTISLVLFSLLLGATWLAGIILGFGMKINFLNFIALPITFGIGVDYGVNIFHRYREEGGENIVRVIRHTGGAVALCSLTTVIGYGSLLLAKSRAFVSFGLLAVFGEFTCILAAILALPAFLLLLHRYRRKKPEPKMEERGEGVTRKAA